MGCQASEARKPNKNDRSGTQEGLHDIQVLRFDDKVTIADSIEGIEWRTKQGKSFLPGKQDDYKILKEYGITKVFLKREKAEEMTNKIQTLIHEKEAEK